ncbi:F-box/kelch-repeat protein At3g23880-like [Rhododendron vialii]|uniref:F-box/kelch-repeat protein At3g23880-like n=1 Tax=Rhododendron vialii TaxID=182163 RepID=UPI00266040FC|nr:F-box/kelch-repeat protein At3g23880-like [Rhododendron vialii]
MAIESDSIRRKNVWVEDSQPLPHLPLETIAEILSRVPVKPLLRFRCVSKSWRYLISDPKFAKAHLSLASASTDYTHHRLLLITSGGPNPYLKSCSVSSIMHEQSDTTAVDHDYPFDKPRQRVWIGFNGSCNGLVCIMVPGYIMYLWKPATRKSMELPLIKMRNNVCSYTCGIGYEDSIDDYKVVVFLRVNVVMFIPERVEVYTLRTHSWGRIGDCPHSLDAADSGKFVSGALHWPSLDSYWNTIVSLDLAKETYGEVLQPDYDRDCCLDYALGVLSGCLCVLSQYADCADVWVMKDYGIKESWTKLIVIPYLTPSDVTHSAPLCILKNNEVLVGNRMHLVWYYPNDAKFSYPTIQNSIKPFRAYPYVESLVSLNSDGGIQQQQQY